MGIIESLIEEIGSNKVSLQVKEICDKILVEEEFKFEYKDFVKYLMEGPNTFLVIEVPGRTEREICFICLEREFSEEFITTVWSLLKKDIKNIEIKDYDIFPLKRAKSWEIKEDSANEILKEFAKTVKIMRGEK